MPPDQNNARTRGHYTQDDTKVSYCQNHHIFFSVLAPLGAKLVVQVLLPAETSPATSRVYRLITFSGTLDGALVLLCCEGMWLVSVGATPLSIFTGHLPDGCWMGARCDRMKD